MAKQNRTSAMLLFSFRLMIIVFLILMVLVPSSLSLSTNTILKSTQNQQQQHQKQEQNWTSWSTSSLRRLMVNPQSTMVEDDIDDMFSGSETGNILSSSEISSTKSTVPVTTTTTTTTTVTTRTEILLSDRAKQSLALDRAKILCENNEDEVENSAKQLSNNNSQTFCPKVWDGALCWPESPPNQMTQQPCPIYVKGFNHMGRAYKNCTSNGTWYLNKETGNYWTDYRECVSRIMGGLEEDDDSVLSKLSKIRHHLPNFQIISHVGYSVSFISLVVAFVIFIYVKFICRRLRCPRNNLHLQLFISFIMRSSMFLIKASLEQSPFDPNQLNDHRILDARTITQQGNQLMTSSSSSTLSSMANENHVHNDHHDDTSNNIFSANDWTNSLLNSSLACKLFTTLWQYSLLANYNWIFMEGLYLHNVIFLNIFNDNSNIIPYVILGWCLPIPVVLLWATMRSLYEDTSCWTTNSNLTIFWIMRAPITIMIVLNFMFFINIIRVLFLKMFAKSAANYARKYKYRTWFRSTLVLVPLFGVHYMVFLAFTTITFNSYDIFEIIWLYTDLTFTTFQGCLVALLYCFFNHEVQIELRKLWHSFKQTIMSSRNFSFVSHHSGTYGGNGANPNHSTRQNTRHSLMSNCSSFFKKEDQNTSSDPNYITKNRNPTELNSNVGIEQESVNGMNQHQINNNKNNNNHHHYYHNSDTEDDIDDFNKVTIETAI